jgi:hypothetical protein
MVITVDISKLPRHLRSVMIEEMQLEYKDRLLVSEDSPSDPHSFILTDEENVNNNNMKRSLKDILIKNKIRNYVIVLDPSGNDIIRILERANVENSGIYHCIHCGMEFDDEMQLSVHHRIHYVI